MLRARSIGLVLAVVCVVALGPGRVTEARVGKSFVVGDIMPCTGLFPGASKNLKLPRYAAGTVFVLKGPMRRTPEGGWSLPKHVVAKQTVRVNATYRFAVFPGHYVLAARLAHSNAEGFLHVTVREGVTVHAVIPNSCK